MNNTLVVNFYGGPGSGKSTMRGRVFAELKDLGLNVEEAPEYAKDMTWQESMHILNNQMYVFAKQQNRIWRIDGKVDAIITDSPLLLSLVYGETSDTFKKLVIEEFLKRPSFNVYLQRVKPYNPAGRSQSLAEAIELDNKIRSEFEKLAKFDLILPGHKESASIIVEKIVNRIEELSLVSIC